MKRYFNSFSTITNENNQFPILPLVLTLVIICICIVGIIYVKKGKTWALISGLIFGTINFIFFLSIVNTIGGNYSQIETARNILLIPGYIFVSLMVIIIPFYLMFVISEFIFSEQIGKIKTKTYLTSFSSLLSLSLFGIFIAILMIPFILLIPNSLFIPNLEGVPQDENSIGILLWFVDWRVILTIIMSSIIFSLILKFILSKEKVLKVKLKLNFIVSLINKYISWVIVAVPFVILTRLSLIGLTTLSNASNVLSLMAIYLGLFWFGAIIIFITMFSLNIFLSNSKKNIKEKSKILSNQVLSVFANQSTAASLPITQDTSRKLGVCEEISKLTPTSGLIMGMVMCNGFTPMLIILLSLANYGTLTIGTICFSAIIIMILAISTSGTGSADYTIILATIGILNLSEGFYAIVVMPVQEINERTITKPNNTLGHLVATQLTEKVHVKKSPKNKI